MHLTFLGTGAAWGLPELACPCRICACMRHFGESRLRTSIYLEAAETILLDCSPDFRRQWQENRLERIDAVVITHEHGDHYLGLDELVALRRAVPASKWRPIPTYATEMTWKAVEQRFSYLLDKTLEKRIMTPGVALAGLRTEVIPFKTYHGASARGSVGLVVQESGRKLVYTSDMLRVDPEWTPLIKGANVLVTQAHWLNEPKENRPNHLSLQRAIAYLHRWQPGDGVFLVHISDADQVPGDSSNDALKKVPPLEPLRPPGSSEPYPIPTCQQEWQALVERIRQDHRIHPVLRVASDGLRLEI